MNKLVARLAALVLTIGAVAPATAQLLPPLPGGSLIVTLTSPSHGATVKDTIPVSASVSIVGTLTVSRVDFFRNGNFIGSDSGSPYSVSWNTTSASNGSHTLTAVAVDVLGARWTSNSVTVNVANGPPPDTTAPNVSITSPANGAAVSGTINVTASASDNVGVTSVQFRLDGVNAGAPDTSAPYSIAWNTTGSSNGTHSISAVARDAAGNTRTSTAASVTVANDKTSPTVTINQAAGQADPTNASPIKFTVVFSESVNGFTADDVTISGTAGGTKTVTLTCGSNTYCVEVRGMTTGGTVIATVAAGVATDAAGNTNTASTSTDNTVTWVPPDTTRPTVTINQAAGQVDPTSASPINFTVVFSESVSGFTGTDVSIGGTAGATTAAVSGGPSTFTVAVSGMTSGGTVTASIGAGLAQDAAGNTNTASTSTDNSVQFNSTSPAPTIASFSPASGPVGTVVTITGNNFNGATGVAFNGVPATTASLDSNTQITATVPGAATTGPISVTAPAGTGTSSTSFTVTTPAPSIISFTPTSGPVSTVVTITGTNFTGATAVTFNTVSAGFLVDSATQIRAEVPAGATTGPIRVTTPGGTATSSTSFTVTTPAPSITSFTPTSGPVGTSVTITGNNFNGATGVAFNGVPATTASLDSNTQITATVPSAATTGPISVTAPAGTATSASAFTVTEDGSTATTSAASAATRIEDTDPAVSYIGAWVHLTDPKATNGTAAIANVAGAVATLSFTGTEVRWLGYRYDGGGIARVSIDGTFVGEVNTYSASPVLGGAKKVFTATFLSSGAHTLTIEVTGTSDPAAVDSWVIIDAFDVIP